MKNKRNKKYFIKFDKESEVCVIKDDFFSDLTKTEALCYGLFSFLEIKKTLIEDAVYREDAYIGNMKVTTGLERFLVKIDEIFPDIIKEIKSLESKVDGQVIFKC